MESYYFTYGTSNDYPFFGGWSKVIADDYNKAVSIFNLYHPPKTAYIINCAGIYTEKEFFENDNFKDGNFGNFCHETLVLEKYQEDVPEAPKNIIESFKTYVDNDAESGNLDYIIDAIDTAGGKALVKYLGYDYKIEITDIEWVTDEDDDENTDLPGTVCIENPESGLIGDAEVYGADGIIDNYLSDEYGFLVSGYSVNLIKKEA